MYICIFEKINKTTCFDDSFTLFVIFEVSYEANIVKNGVKEEELILKAQGSKFFFHMGFTIAYLQQPVICLYVQCLCCHFYLNLNS